MGTSKQILKPFVVTPCLKAWERYCCTVLYCTVLYCTILYYIYFCDYSMTEAVLIISCTHWLILKLFIMDDSVGVAVCVHLAVGIAVQVALGPVKRSRHKDPMAYMCDVTCVTASSSRYRKTNPQAMASHGIWLLSNWHIICTDYKLCKVYADVRMLRMVDCKIDLRRVFPLKLSTPFNMLLSFHYVRM